MNKSTTSIIQQVLGFMMVIVGIFGCVGSFIDESKPVWKLISFVIVIIISLDVIKRAKANYRSSKEINKVMEWMKRYDERTHKFIAKYLKVFKWIGIVLILSLVLYTTHWVNVTEPMKQVEAHYELAEGSESLELQMTALRYDLGHTILFWSKLVIMFITTTLIMAYMYLKMLIENRKLKKFTLKHIDNKLDR